MGLSQYEIVVGCFTYRPHSEHHGTLWFGPAGVVDRVLGSAFVLLAAIMLTIRPFPQMHSFVIVFAVFARRCEAESL